MEEVLTNFARRDGELYADQVRLADIAAEVGTPCYVYSRVAIERNFQSLSTAFEDYPHLICYSVKANSNLAVLNVLARLGSGFDIVSGGELERVLRAGGDPAKVVFSGVGKTKREIEQALEVGIRCIDVESIAELQRVNALAARAGIKAPVAIRVNPDIDANTHPYIATGLRQTKFGIPMADAIAAYRLALDMSHVAIHGIAAHIGSQITDTTPFTEALDRLLRLIEDLEEIGITIENVDIGGGLGVRYRNEQVPDSKNFVTALINAMHARGFDLPLIVEPGRSIVGDAGVLLTKVEYVKSNVVKNFAVVDAGMNDLIRPALYDAWQDIVPLVAESESKRNRYDVVGPVCETADVMGKDRELDVVEGDILAVCTAGAYGWVLSSNYNSRPRPPEVMVDGDQFYLIRHRETIDELCAAESILPE